MATVASSPPCPAMQWWLTRQDLASPCATPLLLGSLQLSFRGVATSWRKGCPLRRQKPDRPGSLGLRAPARLLMVQHHSDPVDGSHPRSWVRRDRELWAPPCILGSGRRRRSLHMMGRGAHHHVRGLRRRRSSCMFRQVLGPSREPSLSLYGQRLSSGPRLRAAHVLVSRHLSVPPQRCGSLKGLAVGRGWGLNGTPAGPASTALSFVRPHPGEVRLASSAHGLRRVHERSGAVLGCALPAQRRSLGLVRSRVRPLGRCPSRLRIVRRHWQRYVRQWRSPASSSRRESG